MTINPDNLEHLRNIFLDKNASSKNIERILANDKVKHLPEIAIDALSYIANTNLDIIHTWSESPIETIFLSSLNHFSISLSSSGNVPPLLLFVEPSESAITTAEKSRKKWANLWGARQVYKEAYPNSNARDFIDFLIEAGIFQESQQDELTKELILFQDVGIGSTYRLMPQAKFPHLHVEGRSLRTDAYIWKPNDEHFNLILECDGYEFHSSKTKFINDRSRDRLLQSKGFDVLRFAGSEINNHPIEVVDDLLKKLFEHHQNTWKSV